MAVVAALLAPGARADVTYQGSGATAVTGSTLTCTPASAGVTWQAGDLLLVAAESENQAISLQTGNGFAELSGTGYGQGFQAAGTAGVSPASRLAVFWKLATGTADAMPVFADTTDHTTCQLYVFRGVDPATPWDATPVSSNNGGAQVAVAGTATIPGIVTTSAQAHVVVILSSSNNATSTTQCSAWSNANVTLTERGDSTNTANLGGGHCMASGVRAAAGTVGNTTVTLAAATYTGSLTLALRPAPHTTQLVTGADPAAPGAPLCPGTTTAFYADQFGFAVEQAADTITQLTVSGLGATTPLSKLDLRSDAGAELYTAAPGNGSHTFGSIALSAPVGTTSYRLYFDVKGHAALPAGDHSVTPAVQDSYVSSNTRVAGGDTASTFTIDNSAAGNVSSLTASAAGASFVVLTWPAVGDATEYVVWARAASAPPETPADGTAYSTQTPVAAPNSFVAYAGAGNVSGPSNRTWTVTGLVPSTPYHFKIYARDACINWSGTAASASATTAAPGVAPTAPGTPTYRLVAATTLTADWTLSVVGTDPITYTLESSASGGAGPWTPVPGCSGVDLATCALGGLTGNTTTYFRVVAANADGTSTSLESDQLTYPAAATMAAFGAVTASSVVVNWTPAPGGAESYAIERSTTSATDGFARRASGAAATTWTDNGVLPTVTYWYRVLGTNAAGEGAPAAALQVTTPAGPFVPEGSTTAGAPMVSIVNPLKGSAVSGRFRFQIRVFNPRERGGIAGVTPGSLAYSLDDGASWDSTGITTLTAFDSSTSGVLTGQTYEVQVAPAAGSRVLRARVSNAVAANVVSNGVTVAVGAPRLGDGRLLVRDNSSQLCTDCHALGGHSTETTTTRKGSWATTCRDCHTPHKTRNLFLVSERVTPPAITGPQSEKTVAFYSRAGTAAQSYATGAGTGVCEVCHTQTRFYRADGTSPGGAHDTSPCAGCHEHGRGFAATCTTCHGSEGRQGIAGADGYVAAAPPAVAPEAAVSVATGGAHVAHVNQATLRAVPLACADCHPMPPVHQEPSQVDVAWSALATTAAAAMNPPAGAVTAAWTAAPSCTNYCHGSTLVRAGGSNRTPSWSGGPSQAQCGTCHAVLPPVGGASAGRHPQNRGCASCHDAGYDWLDGAGTVTAAARPRHLDGKRDVPTGCAACHGQLTGLGGTPIAAGDPRAAPGFDASSVDAEGNWDRSFVGVGAHVKHVNPGLMQAQPCGVCHGSTPASDAHADDAVAVAWAAPANTALVSPSWSAGGCTNYCHSSGKPIGLPVVERSRISWTSTAALGCGDCHASTMGTNAHDVHVTYGVGCQACHEATTANGSAIRGGGGAHVNGANDLAFMSDVGDFWWPFVRTGSYDRSAFTCSSTYCHSNGTSAVPPFESVAGDPLAWNAPGSCASCHGFTAADPVIVGSGSGNGSPRHVNHVANAALIGANFVCGDCHAATVAPGTDGPVTAGGRASHVDRQKTISLADRGVFQSTDTTATCSATYCHSSGQRGPANAKRTVGWTDPAWAPGTVCARCHGTGGLTFGAPDYGGTGTADTAAANSHARHATAATTCATCHAGHVRADGLAIAGSSHTDGTIQMGWDASKAGGGVAFTAGSYAGGVYTSATCSNVKCHGDNATPLRWGGPAVKCSDCHAHPSADTDSFDLAVAGQVSLSEWSSVGHGQASFGANTFPTVEAGEPCLYCHDGSSGAPHGEGTNPFRLRGATGVGGAVTDGNYDATAPASVNRVCLNCHAVSGANGVDPAGAANPLLASTKKIDAWHGGPKHGGGGGGQRCWDCHDPHGDGSNIRMIGRDVLVSGDAHGFAGTRAPQPVTFTSAGTGGYTTSTPPYTGVCQVCHSATTHWRADGSRSGHNAEGVACVACHPHEQPPQSAFRQSTACDACHAAPPATGKHAFHVGSTTPAYGDVAPHATASAYGFGCGKCHAPPGAVHWDDVGGTAADPFQVDVGFDWVSGTTPYTPGTPSIDTASSGIAFRSTTGTCATYCHSDAQPLGAAAPTYRPATWDAGASLACTGCHDGGGATSLLSRAHRRHTDAAGAAYDCSKCHFGTVDAGATPTLKDRTLHVDGAKSVAFDATNPAAAPYASPACGTLYCHSNGNPTGGTNRYQTVGLTWSSAPYAGCTQCHAVTGADQPGGVATDLSGKHGKHLVGYAFTCDECHATVVGNDFTVGSPTWATRSLHVDGAPDVKFSTTLRTGTLDHSTGTYDQASTKTCTNTYCHSNGVNRTTPPYTSGPSLAWGGAVDPQCDSCHAGNAAATVATGVGRFTTVPHAGHVDHATYLGTNIACGACHSATVSSASDLVITGFSSHVNGAVEVPMNGQGTYGGPGTKQCSSTYCHSNGTEAPLVAADYVTVTWNTTALADDCLACHGRAGGAFASTYGEPNYTERVWTSDKVRNSHSKHVHRTNLATAKAQCVDCHASTVDATGALVSGGTHLNGTVEVTVGGKIGGYNPTGEGCSSISCHAGKGAAWGGPQLGCADCHGTTRSKDPSVAGTVDPNLSAAPPVDASGGGVGTIGTGAHQKHVNSGTYRTSALVCTDCHPAPGTTHNGTGDAAWSALASTNPLASYAIYPAAGATAFDAAWEASPSCTNWCHGDGLTGGGRGLAWLWTGTGTTCSSCHGQAPSSPLPPLATAHHPQNTACASCHGGGYATTGLGPAAKGTHINGSVEKSRSGCTLCHGDLTATGALRTNPLAMPGYNAASADLLGNGAATAAGVGAHQKHLLGTTLRTGSAGGTAASCEDCHALPLTDTDVDHATGAGTNGARATITPGAFVQTDGASGAYTGSTTGSGGGTGTTAGTCSVYCHGGGTHLQEPAYVGSLTQPSWTDGARAQVCGSCHRIPPSSPGHPSPYPATTNCNGCHPGYDYTPQGGLVALDKVKHINGQLDGGESGGGLACSSCHGEIYSALNAGGLHRHVVTDASGPGPANSVSPLGTYTTATNAQACQQCHVDHNLFRPDINGANGGVRARNLRLSATAQPTAANPQATDHAAGAGVCVSCHGNSLTKAAGLPDAGGSTPAIAGADYTASAHDYATNNPTIAYRDGSRFTANCSKCHTSEPSLATKQSTALPSGQQVETHASTVSALTPPLGVATTAALEETFCYRCHSHQTDPIGGTKKAADGRDWYGKVAMSAASEDVWTQMQKGTAGTAPGPTTASAVLNFKPLNEDTPTVAPAGSIEAPPTAATNTLYLKSNADDPVMHAATLPTAFRLASGTYAGSTVFSRRALSPVAGAAEDGRQQTTTATANSVYRVSQFLSAPFAQAVTWNSGSVFTLYLGTRENLATQNAFPQFGLWKFTPSTNTYTRLTCAAGTGTCVASGAEFAARPAVEAGNNASNARHNAHSIAYTTNAAVSFAVGDMLLVELEFVQTAAVAGNVQAYWGNATTNARLVLPGTMSFQEDEVAGGVFATRGMSPSASATADETYSTATMSVGQGASPYTGAAPNGYGNPTTQDWARLAFVSPPIVPGGSTVPAGQWTLDLYGLASATATNARVRYLVYRMNSSGANVQTIVPRTTDTTAIGTASTAIAISAAGIPAITLAAGDRVVVDLQIETSRVTAATATATLQYRFGATSVAKLTMPGAATFDFAGTGTAASGRHDVGAYSGKHQPVETLAAIAANKHVECADCHSPHAAATTPAHVRPNVTTAKSATNNLISGVLKGATGVTPAFAATTNWPATTAITYTGPAQLTVATGKEYQICMKCHSGANASLGTWSSGWTDVARDFNPGNKSYHPVVQALPATNTQAYGSVRLGGTKNWQNGWGVGMTMWCTDCHGGETTNASFGPHGSAVKYMLRGGTWPKDSSGAYWVVNGGAVQAGNMCFMCHGALTTVAHTRTGDHTLPCLRCHIRVPHGGKVSRLMAAKGTGAGCGTVPVPYCDPAMPPFLSGFVRAANGTYAEGNCGQVGCTQHAATITNGETW